MYWTQLLLGKFRTKKQSWRNCCSSFLLECNFEASWSDDFDMDVLGEGHLVKRSRNRIWGRWGYLTSSPSRHGCPTFLSCPHLVADARTTSQMRKSLHRSSKKLQRWTEQKQFQCRWSWYTMAMELREFRCFAAPGLVLFMWDWKESGSLAQFILAWDRYSKRSSVVSFSSTETIDSFQGMI